jgi:hypothetical protein
LDSDSWRRPAALFHAAEKSLRELISGVFLRKPIELNSPQARCGERISTQMAN